MKKWRVACLGMWAPEVKKVLVATAPDDFDLAFARTYDEDNPEQLALVRDSDLVLAGRASVSARMVAGAPRVRLIQKWGVGVDRIDLEAARKAGIPVTITAGVNSSVVAEHTVMLMLAVYRRLSLMDRGLRAGRWLNPEARATCLQLRGKVVGLLGMGHIGRMVARKLAGFEVGVIYFDLRGADAALERELGVAYVPFDRLLSQGDIISLHLPLLESTRNLIDRQAIARMKNGAVIINTSRAAVANEADLFRALESGKLFGAGLDVFADEPVPADNPLLGLDQVVVTPHSAASVIDNVAKVATHAFDNMSAVLRGEPVDPADVVIDPDAALTYLH